jgi:hypothetical protein
MRAVYLGSLGLVIVAASGVAACGTSETAATSSSKPATTHASTPARSITPLARSARAGDFAFRVLSVTETPRMPGADQCCTGSSSAGAGETFVVIKVAITNDGKLAETPDNANEASQPAAMLTDSRGRFYSAADQAYNTSWVSGGNYNPGSTVTDKLYFAAPASAVPVRLAIPAAGYSENGQLVSGNMALSVLLKASLPH